MAAVIQVTRAQKPKWLENMFFRPFQIENMA